MDWTEHVFNAVFILLAAYILIRAVLARYFPKDR